MKNPETARRIKEAMDERNITAKELSDKTGISQASLSQYINGSHAPSNKSAPVLGDFLNVNPLWLMGMDVPKQRTYAHLVEYVHKLSGLSRTKQEKVFSYIDAMIDTEEK